MTTPSDDEEIDPSDLDEFTLMDTYDHLKEIEKRLQAELDQLTSEAANNSVGTLSPTVTPEQIITKKCRLLQSMIENVDGYDLEIRPIPKTADMYESVIRDLEKDVESMEKLLDIQRSDIIEVKKNISTLESKKKGLERMKEACLKEIEEVANSQYDAELAVAKKVFASVKKELGEVVALIFPNSPDFNDLLGELTTGYSRGGDDVYVDVPSELIDCVNFLIEADIAVYHPNDKSLIRLMDLV